MMRLVVHDFSGHPFQVQLSRELARRGHEVLHLHCPSYRSGKGALESTAEDPAHLAIEGVRLDGTFEKHSRARRLLQEYVYGKRVARRVERFGPEVVLSSNTPLFAQRLLLGSCRSAGRRFVFWQQDIYSYGMRAAVSHLPVVGHRLGNVATSLEKRMLADSDAVVVISEDFIPILHGWGISTDHVHVVHNWAPIDELPAHPRDNAWSHEHDLDGRKTLLYCGTLGRKHNPNLILQLARRLCDRPDVVVVVASEGGGEEWLRRTAGEEGLTNLRFVGFQPYDRFPEVLASGDVLLLILEDDAGVFSVPSKMLSYQCAGRPLLASVPSENLASRLITGSGSGVVVAPAEEGRFVEMAERLIDDEALRRRFGENARRHAEATFDICTIGDVFEKIIS